MKFCYNTNFTLPKQSQRSRSVLQDRSRSLGLFWKEKAPSYNRRNTVHTIYLYTNNHKLSRSPPFQEMRSFLFCSVPQNTNHPYELVFRGTERNIPFKPHHALVCDIMFSRWLSVCSPVRLTFREHFISVQ